LFQIFITFPFILSLVPLFVVAMGTARFLNRNWVIGFAAKIQIN